MSTMTNTQRTQIARLATSAPARQIHAMNLDRCEYLLHYGEGKALLDTNLFRLHADWVGAYDPYSPRPSSRVFPENAHFEKIIAIYVFNTLPPKERKAAVEDAMSLLDIGGQLIAAVRADTILGAAHFDGVRTKRDTFQKSYTMAGVEKEYSQYGQVRVNYANPGFILFTITKE